VRALLAKKADVNAKAADGSTALHWAVQRNNPQLVDVLLRSGANAKTATRCNVPPLYFAALNGNAPVMERLLAGADANATVYEGQTMLCRGGSGADRIKDIRSTSRLMLPIVL
jgi:hypothetical protein